MSQHLTTQQITRLLARQLAPDEMDVVTAHFADCADCRYRINEAKYTTAHIASLRTVLAAEESEPTMPVRPWRRWLTSFGQWRLWQPLPLVATACALLLVSLGWFGWRTTRPLLVGSVAIPTPTVLPTPSVSPVPPANLLVLNDNGQQIALDEMGRLTGLPELPSALEKAVKLALTKQQVPLPSELVSKHSEASVLMGDEDEPARLKLRSPVGVFVKENRPRFCWQPMREAESYRVEVLDTDFNLIAVSEPVTTSCWRVSQPLARNRHYLWQVTAQLADASVVSTSATLTEARFKVLSAQQSRELEEAVRRYASAHLVLGTLYAQAGLLDDAERAFRQLLNANPQSTAAKKLLEQLLRRRS